MIGRWDIFFRARFFFSILTLLSLPPSSVFLPYFILAVPMCRCLGKHSCMSSQFPIAILNGTFFFRSVKAMNNWKRSAIKQILLLLLSPCCSSVYFCCSHALCHCVQVSLLMIRMFISIWYSDWFIWDHHVCVIVGLSPDLPTYSYLPEKHPFAYWMGLLWCTCCTYSDADPFSVSHFNE